MHTLLVIILFILIPNLCSTSRYWRHLCGIFRSRTMRALTGPLACLACTSTSLCLYQQASSETINVAFVPCGQISKNMNPTVSIVTLCLTMLNCWSADGNRRRPSCILPSPYNRVSSVWADKVRAVVTPSEFMLYVICPSAISVASADVSNTDWHNHTCAAHPHYPTASYLPYHCMSLVNPQPCLVPVAGLPDGCELLQMAGSHWPVGRHQDRLYRLDQRCSSLGPGWRAQAAFSGLVGGTWRIVMNQN